MIGDAWLGSADASGRRIDNPEDWVHIEIAAALNRGILIVPVLVEHARMPSEEELPPALAGLSRRNAMELTDVRWDYDVNNLIGVLVDVVKGPPKEQRRDDRPAAAPKRTTRLLLVAGGVVPPGRRDRDRHGPWKRGRREDGRPRRCEVREPAFSDQRG